MAGIDSASFPRSTRAKSSHWNRVGSTEASEEAFLFDTNEGIIKASTHSVGRSRANMTNREVSALEAGLP